MTTERPYAFRVQLSLSYEEAHTKLKDALKTEGFGVLTSVDMQATLREKLGAQFRKYSILGVCNPPLAQRALCADLDTGLVLPCTVVIYEEGTGSVISIADPLVAVNLLGNQDLRPMAEQAYAKLKRVHQTLVSNS